MTSSAKLKLTLRQLGWRTFPPSRIIRNAKFWDGTHNPAVRLAELHLPDHAQGNFFRNEILSDDPYRYTEYLVELPEPVTVEPLHGLIIGSGGRIAHLLTDVHRSVPVAPPFPWEYWRACRRLREVPEAILLRHHYGEENYGHFYSDVISKFMILAREPALIDIPLIVSRRQFETKYFQGMIARTGLSTRQWIIQDGDAIRVRRLWCVKAMAYTKRWLEFIWDFLKVPAPNLRSTRKIYLRRGGGLRRPLSNHAEIEAHLQALGFEPIDPARLSLDEQIQLFSDARYVVGAHGSGFFNVTFRRGAPLGVVELFPPGYVSTAFFVISHLLGYEYRFAFGSPCPDSAGFSFSLSEIKRLVAETIH